MRMRIPAAAALALFMTAVTPMGAHHAFQAEFDDTKPVKLTGKVVKMEWINPHSWIHVAVPDATGKETIWMVEGGSPNIMIRRGFSKESLKEGTEVTVQGYQAKSGSNRANGGSITFKDGRRLFVGGSNPDDPDKSGNK